MYDWTFNTGFTAAGILFYTLPNHVRENIEIFWVFVLWETRTPEICILLKRLAINESYHISSCWSLRKFTDKLPFLWHWLDLKLPKMVRKLKVAWSPYFSTWSLCFYKERSLFRHVSGSHLRNVYCLNLVFSPRRKNDICYVWPRSFIQTVKCSLLDEKIVYQSFYGALLTFRYFYFKEKLFFTRVSKSLARCLFLKRLKDLVEKIISPVKLHTNRSSKQWNAFSVTN